MRSTARSRALVLEHDLGLELALVGERDLHLVGALDDVVIGDDRPEGSTITPEPSERCTCSRAAVRHAEEAAEDRIVEQRIAVLHDLGGVDVDHRRRHPLHHRRIGQPQFGGVRHAPFLRRRNGGKRQDDRSGRDQAGFQAHGVESHVRRCRRYRPAPGLNEGRRYSPSPRFSRAEGQGRTATRSPAPCADRPRRRRGRRRSPSA